MGEHDFEKGLTKKPPPVNAKGLQCSSASAFLHFTIGLKLIDFIRYIQVIARVIRAVKKRFKVDIFCTDCMKILFALYTL